jgi:hypothetical protein
MNDKPMSREGTMSANLVRTFVVEQAQRQANTSGEPVMVVTCGGQYFVYTGDPMDLRAEYSIVETVEPTR